MMMWSRVDGHLRAHRDAHTDVVIEKGRGHPLWLGRPAQDVFRVFELPRNQRFGGYNTVQIGEEHRLTAAKRLAGDRIPLPNPKGCACRKPRVKPVSSYRGVPTYSTAGVHKAYFPDGRVEVFDKHRGGLPAMKRFIDTYGRKANPRPLVTAEEAQEASNLPIMHGTVVTDEQAAALDRVLSSPWPGQRPPPTPADYACVAAWIDQYLQHGPRERGVALLRRLSSRWRAASRKKNPQPKKVSRAQLAAARAAEAMQAHVILHWSSARGEGTAGPYHEAVDRGRTYAVITDNNTIRSGGAKTFPSALAAGEYLVERIGVSNVIDALKRAARRSGRRYMGLGAPISW